MLLWASFSLGIAVQHYGKKHRGEAFGQSRKSRQAYGYWKGFCTLITFLEMWACLAYVAFFRRHFKPREGESNKDYEVSFGQILALMTWVPVMVEFGYIWVMGPLEALTGQLLEPYQVTSTESAEDEPNGAGDEVNQDDKVELLPRVPKQTEDDNA